METWNSRRSPVLSLKGICSSSQPLASAVGVQILNEGGNAADAAVAMAAALNIVEPCSTGIGGDAFALYYDKASNKVSCFQGNGATPSNLNLELLNSHGIGDTQKGFKALSPYSAHAITVPGAAALWDDLVTLRGRLKLSQVLQPAIDLGNNGFPIHPVAALQWNKGFLQGEEALRVFRPENKLLVTGDIVKNPDLANTFKILGEKGSKLGFYSGPIAESIVETIKSYGGVMELSDLENHSTQFEEAISVVYNGIRVFQTPPPSHGLAVLIGLAILSKLKDLPIYRSKVTEGNTVNNAWETHFSIECMRLAFADALQYIADPKKYPVNVETLLSDDYALSRALLIGEKAIENLSHGDISAFTTGETVYFCCIDTDGNACSFINSNYMGFGSGIVPKNTGFTLHNRGHNFSLIPNHPNCIDSNKRPYHTIIPGLATNEVDGSLFAVFGNMGGFMQPKGHFQLLRNVIDFKLDPQEAIDAPRWYLTTAGKTQSSNDLATSFVQLEDGYGKGDGNSSTEIIVQMLEEMGHHIGDIVAGSQRSLFGRAQIILSLKNNVHIAGSDPRADGCAIPQI